MDNKLDTTMYGFVDGGLKRSLSIRIARKIEEEQEEWKKRKNEGRGGECETRRITNRNSIKWHQLR